MDYSLTRVPKVLILGALALLTLAVPGLFAQGFDADSASFAAVPQAFEPLSTRSGWVLVDGRLFWTDSAGELWQDRTPSDLGGRAILSVDFISPVSGWLAATGRTDAGLPFVSVAVSADGGLSWTWSEETFFEGADEAFQPGHAHLEFLDTRHGWLVLSRLTSSNFSTGELFSTSDGGQNWVRRSAVSGGPVRFVSAEHGWMLSGPLDQEIFESQDGGISWTQLQLPEPQASGREQFFLPTFAPDGHGALPVLLPEKDGTVLLRYLTDDYGRSWQRGPESNFDLEYGQTVPVTGKEGALLASIPVSQFGRNVSRGYPLGLDAVNAPHFQALALSSADYGWGLRILADCTPWQRCTQKASLWQTADGGLTWSLLDPPDSTAARPSAAGEEAFKSSLGALLQNGLSSAPKVEGQGFDTCEVPTLNQLQSWSSSSPYQAVNLYFGGSCRACSNQALSAEFLASAQDQGWAFIPTWVGPQSACFNGCSGSKISSSTTTAFEQGIEQADAAIAEAVRLGLAEPDGSGAVLYYDLEAYSSISTTCRNAAKSFISGWTKRINERGSTAGLYGATCGSLLSDFATIEYPPPAVWAAYWSYSSYNAGASAYNLLCLEDDLWPDGQRIRQYAGDHTENWGSVSLRIDSNVIDGYVDVIGASSSATATPTTTASATATLPSDPTSTATATLTASATATTPAQCSSLILNGGFETSEAWTLPGNAYPAAYSTQRAHAGSRSMRAGIVNGADNVFSYSTAKQTVTLPSGDNQTLDFWLYTQSVESSAVRLPQNLLAPDGDDAVATSDRQMVLILDSSGAVVERLLVDRLNNAAWEAYSFDLSHYAGQTIQIYFGVYNNGSGGWTAMYVDDVSLGTCADATPTATSVPIETATPTATQMQTTTATPTTTPTASSTPSPTATATAEAGSEYLFFLPTMFNDVPWGISGRITDESGAGMAGVTVEMVSNELGLNEIAVSDSAGIYAFSGLEAGSYEIRPQQADLQFEPLQLTVELPPSAGDKDFLGTAPDPQPYPGPE